ncbi:MAG: DUF1028 domain-containing protein [Thermoproteota archaeon]|nr:DUF1028 domain-containing protein [Thermoproteota archaeon]
MRTLEVDVESCKVHFCGTFSILAGSPESELLGVAVATGSTFVADRVPHAKPGVGAVATQAYTNIAYGTKGLELMEKGFSPTEALDKLLERDSGRELRQVAMVNANGKKAVFTGRIVPECHGEAVGEDYVVIGNLLARREVVSRMAEEFEKSTGSLAWRMIRALKAGSDSGGDRRGERSAALFMVNAKNIEVKIKVDEHRTPIKELSRKLRTFGGR